MSEYTEEKRLKSRRLRLFNNVLTVLAVILGFYIIFTPIFPQIAWWAKTTPLQHVIGGNEKSEETAISGNQLFIPSLGLAEPLHEGGLEQLKNGVLRRGHTSTPDKGGNTVLVGHRFSYAERGVFYHLDKVKPGDAVIVHWEGKRYEYTVGEVLTVTADRLDIEDNTNTDVLTIYTCTPLWSAKDRLVVKAVLVQPGEGA